jgi:DMSO/TMAO reductase YedYZ molybdopterin-dependent catalytic subunit
MKPVFNPAPLMRGFVALVAVSALGLVARLVADVPYPPQELFNHLTQFLGTPAVFQLVHKLFGYGAGGKVFAFAGSFALWLVVLGAVGALRPAWAALVVLVVCAALVPVPVALGTAAVYFAVRALLEAPRLGNDARLDRRNALGWLTLGSGLLVTGGGAALLRSVFGAASDGVNAGVSKGAPLPDGVTPQAEFYSISKNLEAFDPKLSADAWRLALKGLVKTPREYTLSELRGRPAQNLELTLVCISNAVGGGLIGNAIWTGFPFKSLLDEVGIHPEARYVIWRAADGYVESLPLAQALEQDVLLVYGMNGEALSHKHGFPLRVLIPNRLGMKQPRWITEIELSATDVTGYWVERGWSKTAFVGTMSRIDAPQEGAVNQQASSITQIKGIAFAGTRTITRVEVSTDGGQQWRAAELLPRRSKYAWQQWRTPWTPRPGSHQLVVRAYADGVLQSEQQRDALPEASSGWHGFIANLS